MALPRMTKAMADILAVLFEARQQDRNDVTGWVIMRLLRRPGPTVYSALDRLEEAGWITGSWEAASPSDNRPRRRYYRLSGTGVRVAQTMLAQGTLARQARLGPQPGFGPIANVDLTG